MKVVSSINTEERLVHTLLAFGELMKPELTGLSVLTALFGLFLADASSTISAYAGLALGTLFVGGGAGTLNQWIERDLDTLMKRTDKRPLPSGRIPHAQALVFGLFLTVAGNAFLYVSFGLAAGSLGVLTSILYLLVYTPLKRRTWHNTAVGAIPGALPVLIGWTASGQPISIGALLLFTVVFIWQFPHFLSLAWLYRKDYAKAGFKMLSVVDSEEGRKTSRLNLILAVGLAGISVWMGLYEDLGAWYIAGVIISNGLLSWMALRVFQASIFSPPDLIRVNKGARFLFFASLVYLPVLMGSALIDRL